MFVFGSFRLDVKNAALRQGVQAILLTPKAFNVLRFWWNMPGSWSPRMTSGGRSGQGISVTDAALTMCMSEIRKALGDDPRTPGYIETVHGLGYRFIAPVSAQPVHACGLRISSRRGARPRPLDNLPAHILLGVRPR